MPRTMTCPRDETPIATLEDDAIAVADLCPRCRRAWQFTRGELVRSEAEVIDDEMRVILEVHHRGRKVDIDDVVPVDEFDADLEGREVFVCERRERGGRWELIQVATAGEQWTLREPADQASVRTFGSAVRWSLVVVFATILAMYFDHWAWIFALIPGAGIVTLLAILTYRRHTTRQRLTRELRAELKERLAALEST